MKTEKNRTVNSQCFDFVFIIFVMIPCMEKEQGWNYILPPLSSYMYGSRGENVFPWHCSGSFMAFQILNTSTCSTPKFETTFDYEMHQTFI